MDSRHAALVALLAWQEKKTFLWESLERIKEKGSLEGRDLNFAYELCCGTMRQLRLLDSYALKICQKLPKKPLERMLLRLGLYQRLFCQNIPAHAVVHSMVELAKKKAHAPFASFLNALLRKELVLLPDMPSYTDYFIEVLEKAYGKEKAHDMLERGNLPTPLSSQRYGNADYIQNITQVELLTAQASRLASPPKKILDLCSAPGGKTLLLHRLFPKATLVANELSSNKIALLEENFKKHACPASISCQDGTSYVWDEPFDLILVDAPCSNSGVLYKCPEARWRIEKEEIAKLNETQLSLLNGAATNLAPHGIIWYQTCSVLPQENEELIQKSLLSLVTPPLLQLPDENGHEGGFSCCLTKHP